MNSLSFALAASADVSLLCLIISHSGTSKHTLYSVAQRTGRQAPCRCHLDRNMIIDCLANLLTHTTTDAPLWSHHQMKRMKIHREGLNRAFRHTGMTTLASRANTVRHRCHTHPHVKTIGNRQERLGRTSGNTGKIVAQFACDLIRKNDRRTVRHIAHDRSRRAYFNAIATACAPFKKHCLIDSTRGTQPVCSHRRGRLLAGRVLMSCKFPRRLRHRHDGVFQEITTPVFRISSHDAPRLHHTVGP